MEHPDIIVINAEMYYARMLQEAEGRRKAMKLVGQPQKANRFITLWKRVASASSKQIEKPVSSAA